jgi:predicted Zn-dependent protease with MMP-like domain
MRSSRTLEEFEDLVMEAVEALPDLFYNSLENVAITVEEWPSRRDLDSVGVQSRTDLMGLYHGIPHTERTHGYNLVPPDRITIYRWPIEMRCQSDEEVIHMVGHVVRHEIAHHFGIDDDRLIEIGAY